MSDVLTNVRWLKRAKRQTDRFGAWEWVEEGQTGPWPMGHVRRVVEGEDYELVNEDEEILVVEIADPISPLAGAPEPDPEEKQEVATEPPTQGSEPDVSVEAPKAAPKKAANKKGSKKKAARRIDIAED